MCVIVWLFLGTSRQQDNNLKSVPEMSMNSTNVGGITRDRFAEYFSGTGSVEWQLNQV